MKKYIKATIDMNGNNIVETPYCIYEFECYEDAESFCNYINNDIPQNEYYDKRLGSIYEQYYFFSKGV